MPSPLRRDLTFAAAAVALAALIIAGVAVWERGSSQETSVLVPTPVQEQALQAASTTPFTDGEYIQVTDGCGPYFAGECVNVRSGPGSEFPVVMKLRNGIVLRVSAIVSSEGLTWYKVVFDETLRYPERVTSDWYVAADYVKLIPETDIAAAESATSTGAKRIVVDREHETLYAFEGDSLFMVTPISTGLELTPTAAGTFAVNRKTPSRYMQGPIPGLSDQYYDLPGVPWDLYFTEDGGAIHGAYWHDKFGEPWSHGCVNLPLAEAEKLYYWADVGTPVIVIN